MVKSLSSILFILLINSNFIYTQIDLSQNWQFQDDLSYFNSEALQEIMDIEIPTLDLISGIIVIHNGKIVSEEYYNGSSEDDIYNICRILISKEFKPGLEFRLIGVGVSGFSGKNEIPKNQNLDSGQMNLLDL